MYLLCGTTFATWAIGLFLGKDEVSQVLGIIISFIGSMLWIMIFVFTDNVIPSYTIPQIANTTQTGGTETCTNSGSTTTRIPSVISKSFSYVNSTGQISNSPDSKPNLFPIFGNAITGANSQFSYIRIFGIIIGMLLAFVGLFQQRLLSRR
jgi:hypothetical protein